MPYTDDGEPRIYFETDDGGGRPLIFIEGLGTQMVGWRKPFLDLFRDRGFRTIRLDNRDVGLSDMFGEPGETKRVYAISDMAQDVTRVLDTLAIDAAHVIGQSMGGAIAQSLALDHPARVASLALIYTAPDFSGAYWGEAVEARREMPPLALDATREEAIEYRVIGERMCTPSHLPFDEALVREFAATSWDRCPRTDGADRQLAALLETADHRERLAELEMPTAIIHGRNDPLIDYRASIALASLIPHAELHLYNDMGHVVIPSLWQEFVAIISRNAAAAER